jgi:hemolysin-activating ACP:hemolysin acyltransferase
MIAGGAQSDCQNIVPEIYGARSAEVDARIRDQIKGDVFPIRLKGEDWQSGDINWLLDVIAPNKKTTANLIANFKQVVKDSDLRLHPIVTRLVDAETLEKVAT